MTESPADILACPICGGPNACGPARSGTFGEPCWCESAAFDATLLARVPEALRGRACICAACAGPASTAPADSRGAS